MPGTKSNGGRSARAALAGIALLCAGIATAQAAAEVSVKTHKRGDAVEVDARATLHAPLELIWQTLTDYDHFAEFIPGINHSRLLEYRGTAAIVEQTGEAGILFFKFPIDVVVESLELAPYTIEVRVLKGNLKQLDGRYQIELGARPEDGIALSWSGVIEPATRLPPLIGEMVLRANVADQFRGMVREIERRHADSGTAGIDRKSAVR
jgi:ribosome-associated toxin RatA of RatAB toxin-antitoxin module